MGKKKLKFEVIGNDVEESKAFSSKTFSPHHLVSFTPKTYPQEQFMSSYYQGTPVLMQVGSAGTGKAQPNDRMVKTPYGWKPIGEIEVGDEIISPDGSVSFVDGVFPQGVKPVCSVVFEDGRSTECCDEHLWKVQHERWKGEFRVLDTATLKEKIDKTKNNVSYRKFRIPLVNGDEENYIRKDVLIDPYILGLYLGDGSSASGAFKITSVDDEIVDLMNEKIIDGYKLSVDAKGITYAFVRKVVDRSDQHNFYLDALSNYGIFGLKSWEKYIPTDYVDGLCKEEKLELLRGLMDSDGEVDSNGSVYYHTTSDKLRLGLIELVRSLGGIAYTKERYTKYEHLGEQRVGRKSYRVRIRYRDPKSLFKLSRKRDRVSENGQYSNCNLGIESIEYIGEKECTCISVDSSDHLYITDDYIVTHNTALAIYCALSEAFSKETVYDKVVVIRSSVQARDIGFLPGGVDDPDGKNAVYEAPYKALCDELMVFKSNNYDNLKAKHMLEFHNTSFLRGLTFDDSIIIVDEFQSMNYHELSTIITRMGINSRIIFCGDFKQSDLHKKGDISGFHEFMKVVEKMPSELVDVVTYTPEDIIRSGICKEFLLAEEKLSS